MILPFFRRFQWFTPLWYTGLAGILWLASFLLPQPIATGPVADYGPFYAALLPLMSGAPALAFAGSFLLLLLQVFLINHITTSGELTDRFSALPGLLYLVLMSSTPALCSPHPVLFANLFLLIGLGKIFSNYDERQALPEGFNVAALISLAGLFYYPALFLFLALLMALFVYYLLSLRVFVAAFLGLLLPFGFLATYYFLRGSLPARVDGFLAWVHSGLWSGWETGIFDKVYAAVLIVLSLISLLRLFWVYMPGKPIRIRKRIRALLWLFVVSALSWLVLSGTSAIHHGLIMIPLGICLSVFFDDMKNRKLAGLVFSVLLLMVLGMHARAYFMF